MHRLVMVLASLLESMVNRNMQYDRQAMQIYSFTGGTTIGITRGTYSNGVSGVYVIILY